MRKLQWPAIAIAAAILAGWANLATISPDTFTVRGVPGVALLVVALAFGLAVVARFMMLARQVKARERASRERSIQDKIRMAMRPELDTPVQACARQFVSPSATEWARSIVGPSMPGQARD
jgi:hypothetical protein